MAMVKLSKLMADGRSDGRKAEARARWVSDRVTWSRTLFRGKRKREGGEERRWRNRKMEIGRKKEVRSVNLMGY